MAIPIKEIIEGFGLLAGLAGVFKKKTYKLVVWNTATRKWGRTHDGPLSARSCRKLVAKLVEIGGVPLWRYEIVREKVHEEDIPEPKDPGR